MSQSETRNHQIANLIFALVAAAVAGISYFYRSFAKTRIGPLYALEFIAWSETSTDSAR